MRTSLMTWIFFSPAASRMTSNSSFSSSASAGSRAGRAGSGGNGNGGGGGDVEGVLELLHELAELEERHLLEGVEQLVGAELRHDGVLSVQPGEPAVVGCTYSAGSAGVLGTGRRRRCLVLDELDVGLG